MPSQQVLQQKKREVEKVTELLKEFRAIGIADLHKVRAPQLQRFKQNLAGKVHMKVIKNTLMERAIEKCEGRPNLEDLKEYLKGEHIYLFTDLNPFKLVMLLEESKVQITAKAGDTAAFDVTVPAGNTGQPPGAIIGQLNAVGLPTRIEAGSVWINKDTQVAEEGEVISERLAAVLSKLGIKAVEAGLDMKAIYDEGIIISGEQLRVDLEETLEKIQLAHVQAFALSLGIAYPIAENIEVLLQLAYREAYSLAIQTAIFNPETIEDLIRKAQAEMLSLSSRIPNLEKEAVSAEEIEKS